MVVLLRRGVGRPTSYTYFSHVHRESSHRTSSPISIRSAPNRTHALPSSTTHAPTATPIHPNSRSTRPESFMHREANRKLPPLKSLSASRRTWALTIPLFLAVLTASALGIFNYQKVNSPIIASTLYALRTNSKARGVLGDEVYFASKWAWVWGHINLVQGRVDVRFKVKGTRRQGLCRFRAKRVGGRNGMFETYEWSITMDDNGEVIQLLDSEASGPLGNQLF